MTFNYKQWQSHERKTKQNGGTPLRRHTTRQLLLARGRQAFSPARLLPVVSWQRSSAFRGRDLVEIERWRRDAGSPQGSSVSRGFDQVLLGHRLSLDE